jgi:hypothetical protein
VEEAEDFAVEVPTEQVRGIGAIVVFGRVVEVAHHLQDGAGLWLVLGVQTAGECGDSRGVGSKSLQDAGYLFVNA